MCILNNHLLVGHSLMNVGLQADLAEIDVLIKGVLKDLSSVIFQLDFFLKNDSLIFFKRSSSINSDILLLKHACIIWRNTLPIFFLLIKIVILSGSYMMQDRMGTRYRAEPQ